MNQSSTSQKTFILGLGAQKAGTSWLHDYLATSGLVATQFIKEYHIWDALHIPGMGHMVIPEAESERSSTNRIRFFMQQSPENYFGYFAYMMNQQGRRIACDITPMYSGLDRGVLRLIKDGFSQLNIMTKAVFLMRDPIERCWSSARMESRNEHGHTNVDDESVLRWAQTRLNELRARYDVTAGEMEAVFPAHNIHLGIYEEMFNPDHLSALSEFCRVPFRPSQTERKLNVSGKAAPLSDDVCEKIARHYRDVYRFAEVRFPQTTELWRGFRFL